MWHGINAYFHPGTTAYLNGLQNKTFADERCEVVRFDSTRERWVVRLHHPRFAGKEILVDESNICLGHCILPYNGGERPPEGIAHAYQEQCNGGSSLVVAGSFQCDEVVFEEQPFLISGSEESCWHSYIMMRDCARIDSSMQQALRYFDNMCEGENIGRDQEIQQLAEAVLELINCNGEQGITNESVRLDAVATVLMKWMANQFSFDNGAEGFVAALFRWGGVMNHSCSPSVSTDLVMNEIAPGSFVPDEGRLVVRALRRLQPGDELCWNYGPPELVSWPVEQRRAHLLDIFGFECKCHRCAAESAVDNIIQSVPSARGSADAGAGTAVRSTDDAAIDGDRDEFTTMLSQTTFAQQPYRPNPLMSMD